MTDFEVTTNPFRPDINMDGVSPHISAGLWKIASREHIAVGGTNEIRVEDVVDYCLAYSMEEAVETVKAKWRFWSEQDAAIKWAHIYSVDFVDSTVLVQRELADAILSE